jgi:hypothetical protein
MFYGEDLSCHIQGWKKNRSIQSKRKKLTSFFSELRVRWTAAAIIMIDHLRKRREKQPSHASRKLEQPSIFAGHTNIC